MEDMVMQVIQFDPQLLWSRDLFLRKPSRPLERDEVLSEDFQKTVKLMLQSLYENPIGTGLAAPQLGLHIRLVVIDVRRAGEEPIVLINPSFTPIGEETVESTETCLSYPQYSGHVHRHKKIRVATKNLRFEDVSFEADGFLAIACQHEIDHLDGILYIDRATDVFMPQDRYERLAEKAFENYLNG